MSRSRTRTAALVTAGVLALGGAATAVTLAQADPTTSPSPAAPSSGASAPAAPNGGGNGGPGGHGHRGGGQFGDEMVSQLASKLGVSEDKVKTALQAARDELKPTTKPDPATKPDPTAREAALAKALASKLGIDEAKVKTALDEIRTAREAERTTAFQAKLDAAVKAGTLTQADADSVLKAAKAGVIGMGGGPR